MSAAEIIDTIQAAAMIVVALGVIQLMVTLGRDMRRTAESLRILLDGQRESSDWKTMVERRLDALERHRDAPRAC